MSELCGRWCCVRVGSWRTQVSVVQIRGVCGGATRVRAGDAVGCRGATGVGRVREEGALLGGAAGDVGVVALDVCC